jgi:hypothetical protein
LSPEERKISTIILKKAKQFERAIVTIKYCDKTAQLKVENLAQTTSRFSPVSSCLGKFSATVILLSAAALDTQVSGEHKILWCHNTQHNNIWYNDTHHLILVCNTQHK